MAYEYKGLHYDVTLLYLNINVDFILPNRTTTTTCGMAPNACKFDT